MTDVTGATDKSSHTKILNLYIISGRSGSGKTTALHVLEDLGFYCVDNLPLALLAELVDQVRLAPGSEPQQKLAIGVDARNLMQHFKTFPETLAKLRGDPALNIYIVFLDASEAILLRRFSETRRKHPLQTKSLSLREALQLEQALLNPIANEANCVIDTSRMTLHELRDRMTAQADQNTKRMSILIQSFGYKHGVPAESDFVLDVRCLPNPHWIPALRNLTGKDQPVIEFLSQQTITTELCNDYLVLLKKWLPRFEQNNRHYITVSIGCTGGQHRSVFLAEHLFKELQADFGEQLQIRHEQLASLDRTSLAC
ncbi:MAG: RNase adapter RapZ [Pseudomonadota bacterium]